MIKLTKHRACLFALFITLPITGLAECPSGPYVYNADIVSIYDADTVTVDIDLGFHTWRKGEKLRLARIDAPEVRGKSRTSGLVSRDWLRGKILGKRILIKSVKNKGRWRGKFSRYLAEIYIKQKGECTNLNDELVRLGLAIYKSY